MIPPRRLDYVNACIAKLGRPYIWNGKGPYSFDCSGLVTYVLFELGGPDWRATHNSQRLANELPHVNHPSPGDLCLYGKSWQLVNHVMVWVDGRVIGASGGNSRTVTREIALQMNACVRWKPKPGYARFKDGSTDFLGFRGMPLL